MTKLLLVHGPNLNMLGVREPGIYGAATLDSIDRDLVEKARQRGHELRSFQSNAEHQLVERVQRARAEDERFAIINPGAFTHTSVALRDAIQAVALPFIEVHLSNIHAREPFRRHSYFSDIARGVISGLGAKSYSLALEAALEELDQGAERAPASPENDNG